MTEPSPSSAASRSSRIVWLTLAALLIYPLSIGPAILLVQRDILSEQAYFRLYAPVIYAHGKSQPIRATLEWYIATIWRAS